MKLEYEEAIGKWGVPPETYESGSLPIPDEEYIKNVRNNCLMDLPNLGIQKDHDKIMVMVCGGTTVKLYLDDIRVKSKDDKYRIFSSNMTHDWLIENNIIPHYNFIIDPKKSKIADVQYPHKDVKYLIGISCNTGVFKALEGYSVQRVFSVSGIGKPSDVEVVKALLPYQDIAFVVGGSMAGLRAMVIADVMGFQKVEFYGFDSCYFDVNKDTGEPIYYPYKKRRKENIIEAKTGDGRVFLTSPVFASQARQFIKWKHRLGWIDFIIHGDSLTATINKLDNEKIRPNHNLLITDVHKRLNQELHQHKPDSNNGKYKEYGTTGISYAGHISVLVGQIIKKFGDITVLDYGCGKRTLEKAMPPIKGMTFKNYDPCMEGLDEPPEPADIVISTDVLEHVELECLENVLDDLQRLTKKAAFIAISTRKATKAYSSGQNSHTIVEHHDWWTPKLKKRFHIVESQLNDDKTLICVLQAKKIL